jgi:hypothetical protein
MILLIARLNVKKEKKNLGALNFSNICNRNKISDLLPLFKTIFVVVMTNASKIPLATLNNVSSKFCRGSETSELGE